MLLLAAPAAFRAAPTPTVAANIVGAMLANWHYVGLLAPLLLLLLKGGGKPPHSMLILVIAILIAAAQAGADARVRAIRLGSPVPISSLAQTDPVRRRFGLLHGISSLLLLCEVVTAGIVVARG